MIERYAKSDTSTQKAAIDWLQSVRPQTNDKSSRLRDDQVDSDSLADQIDRTVIAAIQAAMPTNDYPNNTTSSADPLKTYNGRTLDEWIGLLKTETNPATVCEAIKAMGQLTSNDSEKQTRAIELTRPFVRQYGSITVGGNKADDEFHYAFNAFFSILPFETLGQFIQSELENGNRRSIEYVHWFAFARQLDGRQ
ncbi:MAG: hypothetical protein R3C03_08795 [Pirellulaceae bacterium]